MPLEKLEKELYKPKSEAEERELSRDLYDPEKPVVTDEKFKRDGEWKELKTGMSPRTKNIVLIGVAAVSAILLIAAVFVGVSKYKQSAFSEDRVSVEMEGDAKVKSADSITYKVKYGNNNRTDLKNVEVRLEHTDNFVLEESDVEFQRQGSGNAVFLLGDLDANSSDEFEFTGRFYAPENFTVYMKPTLGYIPANFNSVFKKENQFSIEVVSAPISMSVLPSREALENGMIEYVVNYENLSDIDFKDLKIKVEYPSGFSFSSASTNPSQDNNFWYIGDLNRQTKGELKITGNVTGVEGDAKVANVYLGLKKDNEDFVVYNKKEAVTRIVSSPLVVSHTVDKKKYLTTNLDSVLRYEIEYKNKGTKALRDVIVTIKIDSPIIDVKRMTLSSGGHYDDSQKTVTWKASDISKLSNLSPGDGGTIVLEVPIKERLDILNPETEKNFAINSKVKIDSSDVAYHALGPSEGFSDEVVVKLNSKVVLETVLLYNDSIIANSGPIPPKVGSETTYTVHWKVSNISNDLQNVVVSTFLATGVNWKGVFSPANENVVFNSRTNEVVWNIGNMKNGVGAIGAPRELVFQVGAVPQVNQIGQDMLIINNSVLTGLDLFTNNNVRVETLSKSSQLYDDESFKNVGMQVVNGD